MRVDIIDAKFKLQLLEQRDAGASFDDLYAIFCARHGRIYDSPESLSRAMRKWRVKYQYDGKILETANLAYKFTPHDSTVQVNGKGEVVQAWIKQRTCADDEQWEALLDVIRQNPAEVKIEPFAGTCCESKMLELPLFDMHFGVATLADYQDTLHTILSLLDSGNYEEVNIIIGQDLLHNDDFEGRTTKGTPIEKVDMVQAWSDARDFWFAVIQQAVQRSNKVKVIYSKGNHDKSMSWAFVQMLKTAFDGVAEFDDDLRPRKCISWRGCFIGVGHCEYKKSRANDLFQQFVLDFPSEFANATVREIHAGHQHTEGDKDIGIMVRRLSTGVKTDAWSADNGFTGAHKRFMAFEYKPDRVSAVYYV